MSAVGSPLPFAHARARQLPRAISSFLFVVLALNYIIGGIGAVLRLHFGDMGLLTTGFQIILLPLILATAAVYLLVVRHFRLSSLTATFLVLFVYGAVVGIGHGQLGGPFVSQVFEALFAIVLFIFGRTCQWYEPAEMRRGISWLAKWLLFAHVPIMLVFLIIYSMGGVYFGMSATVLVLSVVVMLREKKRGLAAVAVALILLTGKRADLLGLITAILSYLAITGHLRHIRRGILTLIGTVLTVAVFVVAAQMALNIDLFEDVFSKFQILGELDISQLNSYASRRAIGGRAMEIFVISDALFAHGLGRMFTGLGFGWSLHFFASDIGYDEVIHNVHVSPFDTVAQYGLALAVVWWLAVLRTIKNGFFLARRNTDFSVLVPYCTALVAVAMTAYAVAVDPLFWIIMGAISVPFYNPDFADLNRPHPAEGGVNVRY